jgi:RNA polymerase sigma factor (sigma-70 family)
MADMASGTFGEATRQVCLLYDVGTVAGLSEGQILERFWGRRDEAAFAALVERHGPMVLAVCRRALRDEHAAEDAFQATFLLLVRRSRTIRAGDSLGPWLHRVACRVAANASRTEAKRRSREALSTEAVGLAAAPNPVDHDLRLAIHEAVNALPEKYRAPVVLCDLEGWTHDEAARSLRWPIGSVKGRLSRARQLLKARLIRSGLAPAAAIGAGLRNGALAAVPAALATKTIEAAAGTAAGRAAATGSVPASTALLVEEALRIMLWNKIKTLAAGLVATCLLAASAGVLARQEPRGTSGRAEARPSPRPDDRAKSDLDRLQGRWELQVTTFRGGIGGGIGAGGGMAGPGISAGQALEWITIRGDQLYGTDQEGKPTTPRTLHLDASASPKRFEWRRKSLGRDIEVTKGIYNLDDQTFMICYDTKTPQQPPADFSSDGETTKVFSTYQRDPLATEPGDDEKRELAKLQGTWVLTASERNGEDKTVDREFAMRLTIEGQKARYTSKRPQGMGGMGGMGGGMGGMGGGMGGMGGGMGGMGGGMSGMGGMDRRAATKGVDQRFAITEYLIRLDLARTPRVMELRPPKRPSLEMRKQGVGVQALHRTSYKFDGDTLIMCLNSLNSEDAPAEFVTRPGDGRYLTVFVRDPNPPTSTEAPSPVAEVTPPSAPTPEAASKGADAAQLQRDELARLEGKKDQLAASLDLGELEQEALKKQIRDLEDSISTTETARVTNFSRGPVIGGDSAQARDQNLEKARHLLSELKDNFLKRRRLMEGNRREVERLGRRIDAASTTDSGAKAAEVASVEAKLDRVIAELEALKRRLAEAPGPKPAVPGDRD